MLPGFDNILFSVPKLVFRKNKLTVVWPPIQVPLHCLFHSLE